MTRLLALAALLCGSVAAQESDSPQNPPADSGAPDWAQARMNDVLTGWTDLGEMASAARRQSASFSQTSRSWANQLANASSKASPDALRTAQVLARQHANQAERLQQLSRNLRGNPGAGRVGGFLGRWGTPIAALSAAAGAASGGDAVGVGQELVNGAGSIKATGMGAAAGLYLGGPWGALIGGLAGNFIYGQTAGRAVNNVGDSASNALSGPGAWEQARRRIDDWLREADELASASRSLLDKARSGSIGSRLPILEAKVGAVGAELDLWTERRLQLCESPLPQTDELVAGFRSGLDAVRENLKQARSFEAASCTALSRVQTAPDAAEQTLREHSADPSSVPPANAASRGLLDKTVELLDLIEQTNQVLEQRRASAEEIAAGLEGVAEQAAQLRTEADQAGQPMHQARMDNARAEAVAGQALSLLERASYAASRHAFGAADVVRAQAENKFSEIGARYGRLPAAQEFGALREQLESEWASLRFVLEEAAELESTAQAARQAALDCAPELIDVASLKRDLEDARENQNLAELLGDSGGRCRSEAERLATGADPASDSGQEPGGWDLSGETETLSGPTSESPPAPSGPNVDDLIEHVAGAVRACDYGAALRGAEAVRAAAPEHPWVVQNESAVAQLQPLAGLNLSQALARAEGHLAAGDDAGWAQTIAPFVEAGCQAPALQQHLARAQSQADGRGAARESAMAQQVNAGHARAERNATAFRAAATSLLTTAATVASARSSSGAPTASNSPTSTGGLPTAVGGATSPRPVPPGGSTPPSQSPQGQFDGCVAYDRGTMEDAEYAVIEWVPNVQFDLIPYRKDIGYNPPQGRVVGRYPTHARARAVLDRLCPPSKRMQRIPGL